MFVVHLAVVLAVVVLLAVVLAAAVLVAAVLAVVVLADVGGFIFLRVEGKWGRGKVTLGFCKSNIFPKIALCVCLVYY